MSYAGNGQSNQGGGSDFQTPLGTTPTTGQITVDQQRNQLMSLIATALNQIAGGGSVPNSSVFAYASVSTSTVLTAANTSVAVDASGGAVTLTLPLASAQPGKMLFLKKTDSSANQVTIARAGSDTIDGNTAYYMLSPGTPLIIQSFGAGVWYIMSGS